MPASRPPKLYTAQLSGRSGRGRDGVPIVLGEAAGPGGATEDEVYWLPKPWASVPSPAPAPQSEVRTAGLDVLLCTALHCAACGRLRGGLQFVAVR